jgi:hypothetical protein
MRLREAEYEANLIQRKDWQFRPYGSRSEAVPAREGLDKVLTDGPAQQRHARGERRAALAQPRRERLRDGLERKSLALTHPHDVRREDVRDHGLAPHGTSSDRDHGKPCEPRPPQNLDVRMAGSAGEDVHIGSGALRPAEPHGTPLSTAAKQLLPQLGRQLTRSTDRKNVVAGRPLEVAQQLPDRVERNRKAGHQRRRE